MGPAPLISCPGGRGQRRVAGLFPRRRCVAYQAEPGPPLEWPHGGGARDENRGDTANGPTLIGVGGDLYGGPAGAWVVGSRPGLPDDAQAQAFGDRSVLTEISLALASGDKVGVIGAHGSGKSTLLRIIAGVEVPTSGESVVGEVSVGLLKEEPWLDPSTTMLGSIEDGVAEIRRIRSSFEEISDQLETDPPDIEVLVAKVGELGQILDRATLGFSKRSLRGLWMRCASRTRRRRWRRFPAGRRVVLCRARGRPRLAPRLEVHRPIYTETRSRDRIRRGRRDPQGAPQQVRTGSQDRPYPAGPDLVHRDLLPGRLRLCREHPRPRWRPLDAMVLVDEPTFPGCAIRCRPSGMFRMTDEHGQDDKVLCVPAADTRHGHLRDINHVPEFDKLEISTSSRSTRIWSRASPCRSWVGRAAAEAEIEESRRRLAERHGLGQR